MLKRGATLLLLVSMAALASEANPYVFDLTVRIGSGVPVVVHESLSPGTYKSVDVMPDLHFDLVAPADARSPTIVRLMDMSGAEPRVLHTAQRGGSAELVRAASYTLCKDGVHFESPGPSESVLVCRD